MSTTQILEFVKKPRFLSFAVCIYVLVSCLIIFVSATKRSDFLQLSFAVAGFVLFLRLLIDLARWRTKSLHN